MSYLGCSKYVDLDGNRVRRTPYSNPYNYDTFVQWSGECTQGGHSVYSDRLYQWDWEKYNRCCMEVWGNQGQYFDNRTPEDINKFLNLYFGEEVKLTTILQGCNQSTGFPYWCFIYEKENEEKERERKMSDHSYNYHRYSEWRKKISNKDELKSEKKDALSTAIDLCYGDETLSEIVYATTEMQIYRALMNARNCA